jgi:hypothetical protein
MSPASYLAAPPRVAGGMIAPLVSLTVLALVVGIVAVGGSLAYAIRQALRLWRDVKAFFRGFGEATDALAQSLDRLSAFEPPDIDRVADSAVRLRRSSAELSVLLHALGRVRDQWAGLAAIYPRK